MAIILNILLPVLLIIWGYKMIRSGLEEYRNYEPKKVFLIDTRQLLPSGIIMIALALLWMILGAIIPIVKGIR
jgi:hypothetical protein